MYLFLVVNYYNQCTGIQFHVYNDQETSNQQNQISKPNGITNLLIEFTQRVEDHAKGFNGPVLEV